MSRLNEIKTSIENIKGTQKITRAMYLISTSKSQAAKNKLLQTRPYFRRVTETLSGILKETKDFESVYLKERAEAGEKGNLYIVLAADKGQAGGYNHNIISLVEKNIPKENSTLWVAGFVGRSRIKQRGYNVSPSFTQPVMNPTLYGARDVADLVIDEFLSMRCKEVYIVFTEMVSTVNLEPVIAQLLPLKPENLIHEAPPEQYDPDDPYAKYAPYEQMVYEPSPNHVFDHLVPHYLKGVIYGAFVNAYTSELQARMFAMDNATKNASEMLSQLSLEFNRTRQAIITQEINEIVGGIPAQ